MHIETRGREHSIYKIYGKGIQGKRLMFSEPDDVAGPEHHLVLVSASKKMVPRGEVAIYPWDESSGTDFGWPLRSEFETYFSHREALAECGIQYVIACDKVRGRVNPPRERKPCLAPHAELRADPELWDRCEFVGIQEGVNEGFVEQVMPSRNPTPNGRSVLTGPGWDKARAKLAGAAQATKKNPPMSRGALDVYAVAELMKAKAAVVALGNQDATNQLWRAGRSTTTKWVNDPDMINQLRVVGDAVEEGGDENRRRVISMITGIWLPGLTSKPIDWGSSRYLSRHGIDFDANIYDYLIGFWMTVLVAIDLGTLTDDGLHVKFSGGPTANPPREVKPCLAPHAELRADPELWERCEFVGIQEGVSEGDEAMELRDCTCGSTLSKKITKEAMPPKNNPAWVTTLLAKHFETLEDKVPAKWLPKLTKTTAKRGKITAAMKEYGCGAYGCVLPTLDPKVVLKITTDDTEAEFANKLSGNLTAQVTCTYHLVAGLPERHKGRSTYLLWRDSAERVGEIDKVVAERGGDAEATEAAIDAQHKAAQAVFRAFHEGEPAVDLIEKWKVAARAMGTTVPELHELADGMLMNLKKDRVFMSDLHAGNIGLIDGRWLCVDPGNVAVLTD